MDVFLDGKPLNRPALQARTVSQLLSEIRAADGDRLVVVMRLDGQEVTGEAIEQLRIAPLDGPGRLELETESARLLAARTLGEVANMLEDTRPSHAAIAELLAGGKTPKAMELLTSCLTVWNAADQSLQNASRLVGLDLDAPAGPGRPAEMIGQLREHLQLIKHGLEIRDFVAISDLVEHDMPQITDLWQRMLVGLQEHLLAQP